MIRFAILVIIVAASLEATEDGTEQGTKEDGANDEDMRILVLRKFHDQYLKAVMSPSEVLVSWYSQDFQHTLADNDVEIISASNFTFDAFYFLYRGLKGKFTPTQANTELFIDMYVKYLAMWASLLFKVCVILGENKSMVDDADALLIIPQDCITVSSYMAWFHSVYINEIIGDTIMIESSHAPSSSFEERFERIFERTFTIKEIRAKLEYINAVTNLIHFTFNPETSDTIIPKIYPTEIFTHVKEILEKQNYLLFHKSLRKDHITKTPASVFQDDTYHQMWLRLLALYGEPLMDVENYFASMLGESRRIRQIKELIPPMSSMMSICKAGTKYSEFLSFPTFDSNQMYTKSINKAGRILTFIENVKRGKHNNDDERRVPNLKLKKAEKNSIADYEIYVDDTEVVDAMEVAK